MKKVKKMNKFICKLSSNLILFLISLTYLYSCKSVNDKLYGEWRIYEVYYKGTDISGINQPNSSIRVINNMSIGGYQNFIVLPRENSSNTNEPLRTAKFKYYRKDKMDILEIYNSDDKRYNGKYIVDIKEKTINIYIKRYYLELKSKNIHIKGDKGETNLLPSSK